MSLLDNIKLNEKFWEKYLESYDVLNSVFAYREMLSLVVSEFDSKEEKGILDIGSGTGNFAVLAKEKGFEVTCVDSSKKGFEIHKRKDDDAKHVLADVSTGLPFDNNSFKNIVCINTLHFFPQEKREDFIREIFRVLRSDGKFALISIVDGYNPLKIYIHHVKQITSEHGLLKGLFVLSKIIWPTVKMFYYNLFLKNTNKSQRFIFEEEQFSLLKKIGFSNISKTKRIFANQAVFNSAFKL